MTLAQFQACIDAIPYGKRLPGALYAFRSTSSDFGPQLNSLLANLVEVHAIGSAYNLIKFRTNELKLSFLSYPNFISDPHPALRHAVVVDLVTGKARHTDYGANHNPPILHRKESFLPKGHPQHDVYSALTEAEVHAGLYENAATIGFKLNWERLLKEKGMVIEGHTLKLTSPLAREERTDAPVIERHKTAMTRYDLSKPVKSLLEYGVLKGGMTFFDYGCGQGSDVRGLVTLGHRATGWDPAYQSTAPKAEADIVNMGYVLNVIEDPAERLEALVDAFRYAKRLLVVSGLICETVSTETAAQYRDGVVTKRNTFQKFYEQQELQQYIEDALDCSAIPVALGVFYVFRDPVEQQDFLSARSRRNIDWSQISERLGLGSPCDLWKKLYDQHKDILNEFGELALKLGRIPEAPEWNKLNTLTELLGSPKRALRTFVQGGEREDLKWEAVRVQFGIGQPVRRQWEVLYEEHRELLEEVWNLMVQLGRHPEPEEFPKFGELREKVGTLNKAEQIFINKGGAESLKQSSDGRQRDLLVYVALANLRKKVPFGHLSARLRWDIRAFFGNYTKALKKGMELLYSAGDSGEIELACEGLKIGWQDEQALYVHCSLLSELPPVLRAYVGCATALFGAAEQTDLVKIHKSSGKVTFLVYDDFEGKVLPELKQRIKVNLRSRWVQVFDHSREGQLLFYKERFVSASHPMRLEWEKFSAKAKKLGVPGTMSGTILKIQFNKLREAHGLNENLNATRDKREAQAR